MRLLYYNDRSELSLTGDLSDEEIPEYAILSHTWGSDLDEVTLQELRNGPDKSKTGYKKLQLCGEQARTHGLDHFWVDTCCIDKTSSSELSKNLNLMFRYYQNATKCFVYLSDVDDKDSAKELRESRWFKRGWTLQELLAPKSVDFFSSKWEYIGNKATLEETIQDVTHIPLDALRGADLSQFSQDDRMCWSRDRDTKEKEDKAYCLLGIFGVSMAPRYGEGEKAALTRLKNKIRKNLKPTLQTIDGRIRDYYLSDGCLDIERLSGQYLPMDRCFINLSIINKSDPDQKTISGERHAMTLESRLKVDAVQQDTVSLRALFEPQGLAQGMIGRAKRVVIWGRAGMGKTTLCKKIVYDFLHNDLWQDLYERVFWIPLRRLKLMGNQVKSVAQMIQQMCFYSAADGTFPADILGDILEHSADRCLFILDGLDEVSHSIDYDSPIGANFQKLLKQANVLITSRPHSTDILRHTQPDLQFETTGFLPEQVKEFLHKEVEQGSISRTGASAIQTFIHHRPVVQSLVRIPIQLDAVCYSWDQELFQQDEITMTLLYQAISSRLWQRDVVRLGKKHDGECITPQQIQSCINVRPFVEPEISCLEELAFTGLYNQLAEFSSENINRMGQGHIPLLHSRLPRLSFLRSSETRSKSIGRTNHFIHLTFQEFFAAQYFVRHWSSNMAMVFPRIASASMRHLKHTDTVMPTDFIWREKYNPRYDIFWRFVVGLIQMGSEDESLARFFKQIETEPCDQLGTAHQLLVVHCLNEIPSSPDQSRNKAQELEHRYQMWVLCISKLIEFLEDERQVPNLLRMPECPRFVLRHWLNGTDMQKLRALTALLERSSVTSEFLSAAIEEGQWSDDQDIQDSARAVVAKHCEQTFNSEFANLFTAQHIQELSRVMSSFWRHQWGRALLLNFVPLLCDEDSSVCAQAVSLFYHQLDLPEPVIHILVRMISEHNWSYRFDVCYVLHHQNNLSEAMIESLTALLHHEDPDLRTNAAIVLSKHIKLSDHTITSLVAILDSQDLEAQHCARFSLQAQDRLLPQCVSAKLTALLQDPACRQPATVACALAEMHLSEHSVETFITLLRHEDSSVRCHAVSGLIGQRDLPEDAIILLIGILQGKGPYNSPLCIAKLLRWQNSISERVIRMLINLLQDQSKGPDMRSVALHVLKGRSKLPEHTVEILVDLIQHRSLHQWLIIKDAFTTCPIVPKPQLDTLISLLRSEEFDKRAICVLERRAEFYESITTLDSSSLQKFIRHWLYEGNEFQRHSYVTLHDNTFFIDIDGQQWTASFEKAEFEAFKQRWLEARKAIGVPLFHESCDVTGTGLKRKTTNARASQKKQKTGGSSTSL